MEVWKKVENTNGMIEISNFGRVRSLLSGKPYILKTCPDKKGYHRLRITIDRKKLSFKLHRLVAIYFVDNPENKEQVNHIDGNKNNNSAQNLEWCTNLENSHHAMNNGLWGNVYKASCQSNEKRKTPIIATKDGEIKRFESISEAERYFNSRHICDVLKGKRQHVKGWNFHKEVM